MVSKAKKAQRRQRQQARQQKLKELHSKPAEAEPKPEAVLEPVEPPEGSTCGHFKQVSLPSLRSAISSAPSLYCQVSRFVVIIFLIL